ncbi:MAG: hypothetical protein ACE5HT_11950 [Gemmatimonadales bacterium]
MPPLLLPVEHFAAALTFLGLGAIGLLLVARDLSRGAYLTPHVIAVTHCFTLGWITMSIFGALYQLFPVVLGVPARSIRLGHVSFWSLAGGVAVVIAGAWTWRPALLALGWSLVSIAILAASWNLLPRARYALRNRAIARYVTIGVLALWLAIGIAATRIGAALGWWRIERLGILAAHAHLAALGFATTLAVGMGSRLLPMFLLSRGHAEWPLRFIGPVIWMGVLLLAGGQLAHLSAPAFAGGLLVVAGLILYFCQVAEYFRCRTRESLDPAMGHVVAAVGFLAIATTLGAFLLFDSSSHPHAVTTYGVVGIMGWLTLVGLGMYSKILPFLVWLHRFSPRVGEKGLPKIVDLTSPRLGWVSLGSFVTGIVTLAIAITAGIETATVVGAGGVAAGIALALAQYGRMAIIRSPRRG